jgi:hypothetical protein
MAKRRSKQDVGAKQDALAFEYTEEEWAEIVRSLQHLQLSEGDLRNVRRRLGSAASWYRQQKANAPREKAQERWLRRAWAKIAKRSDEMMRFLDRYSELLTPPSPSGGPVFDHFAHEREILTKVKVDARDARDVRGRFAKSRLIDDGYPTAGPRTWYQFHVLETWTRLGGKLQFSRHPQKHKITGPLARYFSAVTQPVLGGSLESLPDIVKRHKAVRLVYFKWVVSRLMAKSFAEAMSEAAEIGLDEWANQDDVQALLKEAFGEMPDEP